MKAGVIALIVFGGLTFPTVGSSPFRVNNQAADVECQDGDIVLRNGKGFISSVMRNTSARDKKYSHAGIIIVTDRGPYVIHSIGNSSSRLDGVRAEPLSEFISAAENLQYGVYRYELSEKQQKAVREKALEWKRSGAGFDTAFDLSSNDKVYCSELIYKIYNDRDVAADFINPTTTAKGSYIGLDDLYLNENCRLVTEKLYDHE